MVDYSIFASGKQKKKKKERKKENWLLRRHIVYKFNRRTKKD